MAKIKIITEQGHTIEVVNELSRADTIAQLSETLNDGKGLGLSDTGVYTLVPFELLSKSIIQISE